MAQAKKQFLFVHIPKTAGTTFALILTRQFRFKKKLAFYSPKSRESYAGLKAPEKEIYDLIYGHIPFIPDPGLKRGIEYFTFLRNPRERLLSNYRHIKGDGNHVIKKQINVEEYSLKDFLKTGIVKNFDNLMVRYLSGNLTKKNYLEINEEDLDLAIKNFDTYFNIFGITEYFDESLVLLADHMEWPPLLYVKENKSAYRIETSEFDMETEQLINNCCRYDEILYRHALNRFKSLMEKKRTILEEGLKQLRMENEKHKNLIALRNRINLVYARIRQVLAN